MKTDENLCKLETRLVQNFGTIRDHFRMLAERADRGDTNAAYLVNALHYLTKEVKSVG